VVPRRRTSSMRLRTDDVPEKLMGSPGTALRHRPARATRHRPGQPPRVVPVPGPARPSHRTFRCAMVGRGRPRPAGDASWESWE
jgi:hypothetical protein